MSWSHPTALASGYAVDDRICGYVAGDHRTGSNQRPRADRDTGRLVEQRPRLRWSGHPHPRRPAASRTRTPVLAASWQDRDGAKGALVAAYAATPIRYVFADQGFAGRLVDWCQHVLHTTLEIVRKPADQEGFVVHPRRWVVERTLAWITSYRRLARDYERDPAVSPPGSRCQDQTLHGIHPGSYRAVAVSSRMLASAP